MATYPEPPRPPAPPPPPGSGSHFVAIALLFLAPIVLVAGVAVWVYCASFRMPSTCKRSKMAAERRRSQSKRPWARLQVHHDLNEASLGLPIYPEATRLKDHDSATVNIDIADETKVRVLAGKFETPDSVEKVRRLLS